MRSWNLLRLAFFLDEEELLHSSYLVIIVPVACTPADLTESLWSCEDSHIHLKLVA